MNLQSSSIKNLISLCRENNRTGHTRTCPEMFDKAEAEHAALVAVAEAAQDAEALLDSLDLRPAHQATATELREALANLAAVREGGAIHNWRNNDYGYTP